MNDGPSLLSSTQLKEWGRTLALVKKSLGSPDATKPNPYSRSAASMQLYSVACVEVCEQEVGWKQAAVGSEVGKTVTARYPEDAQECKRQMCARHGEAS